MKTKLFLSALAALMFAGCYYDIEEELYNCTVDATSVKYSTTVNTILLSYGCLGCHAGSAPSGGITLSNYAGIKAVADNGRLYGAISHAPGYPPMPQGGDKMSGCDLKKIKAWIDAGAPNN